jgi:hypothetical protein
MAGSLGGSCEVSPFFLTNYSLGTSNPTIKSTYQILLTTVTLLETYRFLLIKIFTFLNLINMGILIFFFKF